MSDTNTADASTDAPDDTAKPDSAAASAADKPDADKPESTFSQADLDRIVADRITRERAKYKDYGDLKAKAAEHDKAVEAQKTAEQRAQDEADRYKRQAEDLQGRLVRASVKAQAAAKDFADSDDAGGFLSTAEFVNADGEVDTDAIDKALDELLERKPHLRKAEPGPRPPMPNAAQGSSGQKPAEVDITPGMGRLRYAYGTSK
jgi:uncharacterized protein YdaU (DUF1376 family)